MLAVLLGVPHDVDAALAGIEQVRLAQQRAPAQPDRMLDAGAVVGGGGGRRRYGSNGNRGTAGDGTTKNDSPGKRKITHAASQTPHRHASRNAA
ncbi:hypothetical protein Psuf_094210 [Phytohabitans suffuscus]|uniref:Uncharacterized protein n=1 Tax=Phytohabitans suffuscus TaxID=624315 RepID=A0A6F8Z1Q7_9ACTN|nr:hypothetical protein Psuf_094210 [Phytohabitans suffuscus]